MRFLFSKHSNFFIILASPNRLNLGVGLAAVGADLADAVAGEHADLAHGDHGLAKKVDSPVFLSTWPCDTSQPCIIS